MQQRKGPDYLKKLDTVVSDIQNRIKLTESFLENDSGEMGEEMAGNLRSSVGKANLLITQKLNQFRGLCHKNMKDTSDDQFVTKNEDLDGFWEMVSFQINDINKQFDDILRLKENGWKVQETQEVTLPKIVPKSPKKNCTVKLLTSSTKNAKDIARDELRRAQLRDAKLKLAQKAQESKNKDEIAIFVASNGENSKISEAS